MRKTTIALLAACMVIVVSVGARAQDPVRLPGVQVTAPMEKPHARAIVGIVRDTFAIPVDGAEISIVDLKRRVFAGRDGKFRIDDIKPGEYELRARKLGYGPQIRMIKVDDDGGVGEFELLPIPQQVQPMIVSSARGGLTGVVGDTAFKALHGAVVHLLGTGRLTETDSLGRFAFNVRPGQYFVSVQQPGFADKTLMVRVPKDSGRYVAVYMAPRNGKRNPRSAFNMTDLASRMASRMTNNSTVYSTEDLADMGVTWIGDAIQSAVTRTASKVSLVDDDCFAVLNGGPEIVSVKGLTREDIVSMEVYAGGGDGRRPVPVTQKSSYTRWPRQSATAITGMTNTKEAADANFYSGKRCPTIYVWKR